eukprot:COSAG05_NODE_1695_length_4263_cov_9.673391_4_plen_203_part_00
MAAPHVQRSFEIRAATAADREPAMAVINAAYKPTAFVKLEQSQDRIRAATYDEAIANASGVTELLLALEESDAPAAVLGAAMLNPPRGGGDAASPRGTFFTLPFRCMAAEILAWRGGVGPVADLGFVAVVPDQQRRGIGRALIGATERRAQALGFSALEFSHIVREHQSSHPAGTLRAQTCSYCLLAISYLTITLSVPRRIP